MFFQLLFYTQAVRARPLKIPLLKLPAVRSGKFVWLFRLCMNRAERICKLSVYMKTRAAYVPLFPFTEAEVHTLLRQPPALSGTKKRRRDFYKGEPWFTSLAPCRRHAPQRLPAQKNPDTQQHHHTYHPHISIIKKIKNIQNTY